MATRVASALARRGVRGACSETARGRRQALATAPDSGSTLGASLARTRDGVVVRVLERLHTETEVFHAEADEDIRMLFDAIGPADYWRYLVRTYGFIAPVERAVVQAPGIGEALDIRRFHKHNLLRQDLLELGMQPAEVDQLPQCPVPAFATAEEALGWAYVVERSTLGHSNLFRHLGMVIPGTVAFTSTYLKCYFGAVGEMWRSFGNALERFAEPPESQRLLDAAAAAFHALRTWRQSHDDFEHEPPSETDLLRSA
jgi:heme oxygenase